MARDFDTTDDYLHKTATLTAISTDMVWWCWNRAVAVDTWRNIYALRDASTLAIIAVVYYATGEIQVAHQDTGAAPRNRYATTTKTFDADKWWFIAGWYDAGPRSWKIYWADLNSADITEDTNNVTAGGNASGTIIRMEVGNYLDTNWPFRGELCNMGLYVPTDPTQAAVEDYLRQRWRGVDPSASDLYCYYPLNSGIDSGTTDIELDYGPNGYDLSTNTDSTRPSPVEAPPLAHLRRFGGMPI